MPSQTPSTPLSTTLQHAIGHVDAAVTGLIIVALSVGGLLMVTGG